MIDDKFNELKEELIEKNLNIEEMREAQILDDKKSEESETDMVSTN